MFRFSLLKQLFRLLSRILSFTCQRTDTTPAFYFSFHTISDGFSVCLLILLYRTGATRLGRMIGWMQWHRNKRVEPVFAYNELLSFPPPPPSSFFLNCGISWTALWDIWRCSGYFYLACRARWSLLYSAIWSGKRTRAFS